MNHPAAFINAIAEEGTKAEAVEWLQKTWDENCKMRAALRVIAGEQKEMVQAWMVLRDQYSELAIALGFVGEGWWDDSRVSHREIVARARKLAETKCARMAALERIVRECDAMNKGPVAVMIAREALNN